MADIQEEDINSIENLIVKQPDVKKDNIDNTVEEETPLATVLLCKQLLGKILKKILKKL